MSSISCWTSATRCSNSSVSHPTSNSYPSTFSWSIHRWRDFSPLSILSALHLRASPSIRDPADWFCVFWVLGVAKLGYLGRDFQPGQRKALRGRRYRAHKGRAKSRQRKIDSVLFIFPDLFTLIHSRWRVPFGLFILPLHHPPDMRRDVQEIFRATPHHKQVMMFSATLAKDIRVTCKKFMANVCSFLERRILILNIPYSRSKFLLTTRQS
jgi:hypothetical protein